LTEAYQTNVSQIRIFTCSSCNTPAEVLAALWTRWDTQRHPLWVDYLTGTD